MILALFYPYLLKFSLRSSKHDLSHSFKCNLTSCLQIYTSYCLGLLKDSFVKVSILTTQILFNKLKNFGKVQNVKWEKIFQEEQHFSIIHIFIFSYQINEINKVNITINWCVHSHACANGQMPIYAIKTQFPLRNSAPLKSSHPLDLWRPYRGCFEIFKKVKYISVS